MTRPSCLVLMLLAGNAATTHIPLRKSSIRTQRHRRLQTSPLEGSAAAGYQAEVTIAGQTLHVTIDSGSSTFAVVTAPTSADCAQWYTGVCNGTWVTANYGHGSWSGQLCSGADVTLGGLAAGEPSFVGIAVQTDNFLNNCNPAGTGVVEEGIIGVAYPSLVSAPLTQTLLQALVATSNIANMFSMQCCGWDGATAGTGTLVVGGTDPSMYSGTIEYVSVVDQSYYCVTMTSPSTSGGTGNSCSSGNAIIDSGTGTIVLTAEAFETLMQPVASALGISTTDLASHSYSAQAIAMAPDISIEFEGGVRLTIPPSRYFQPTPGRGSYCYMLYVSSGTSNIIGQPLLESYYTVFDQEYHRVGFAPIAGCPSLPLSCAAAAAATTPPSPPPTPPIPPPSACVVCAGAVHPTAEVSACGSPGYCGWCDDTQQCVPASSDGNSPRTGSCNGFIYQPNNCPVGLFPQSPTLPPVPPALPSPPAPPPILSPPPPITCITCASANSEIVEISQCGTVGWCGWCAESQRCVPSNVAGTGPRDGTCFNWIFVPTDCISPPPPPPPLLVPSSSIVSGLTDLNKVDLLIGCAVAAGCFAVFVLVLGWHFCTTRGQSDRLLSHGHGGAHATPAVTIEMGRPSGHPPK